MPHVPVYQPLADLLAAHPGPEVTLTFAQLEAMLGAPLPAHAWTRAWWRNEQGAAEQARAWLAVGWLVRWVRRARGHAAVTFVRAPAVRTRPRQQDGAAVKRAT